MPHWTKSPALRVIVFLLCGCARESYATGLPPKFSPVTRMVQWDDVAAGFATALDVSKRIEVAVVPRNELVVSVESLTAPESGYRVLFEQRFYDLLTEEEVSAALAHELGHVWIYSHFPFLQTEALANEIALRVVTRKPLQLLYDKLWTYTGVRGNIDDLLGPPEH